ncbi:flavin reductase [Microbaculum sp. FT89]|uniref:flavin reductase n=1 Tax=Microbaculum sp. FT89 TaxID=3447298 RepID=UPI003F53C206
MSIDRTAFRTAMSRLGASVNLITTDGPAGRYGMIASAVCSVTDDPPTVLVCINRSSTSYRTIRANRVLCVNVLAADHEPLSRRFSDPKLSVEDRFAAMGQWTSLVTGSPVLHGASVALDCKVTAARNVGTHCVFFCEVADAHLAGTAQALIYFDRTYHPLTAWQAPAADAY